jgi:hypothetical protein
MSARAEVVTAGYRPGLETIKWLGLVAMFYDHVALFGGVALPAAEAVGALALPMFAIALGHGLSGATSEKILEVGRRMLFWGFLAQVPLLFVREAVPLNILFTLGFATLAYGLAQRPGPVFRVGTALALFATLVSEFSILGGGFVFAALVAGSRDRAQWLPVLASVPLFMFNSGSFFAVPGTLLAILLTHVDIGPPRIAGLFYWLYVGQWFIFAVA